jgi:hypothetical protein
MFIPVGKTFAIVDDDGITGDLLHAIATWRLGLRGRAHNWKLADGYVVMQRKRPSNGIVLMHRLILELDGQNIDGLEVDHDNGNRLDNRRENLRPATKSQNMSNRGPFLNNKSGFKGVCWHKRRQKWIAQIHVSGKRTHLGYFDDPIAAARAYDAAALELHGAFARLNFPPLAA